MAGRPVGSHIRDEVVDIIKVYGPLNGYQTAKIFRTRAHPAIVDCTLRSIYVNLKTAVIEGKLTYKMGIYTYQGEANATRNT